MTNLIPARWPAGSSQVKYILAALFVLSLVTLALGITTTVQISTSSTYLFQPVVKPPSTAVIFFYAAGLPLATTLAHAIELAVFFTGLLHPILSIVWSIIALAVWIYVEVMWGVCEFSPDTSGEGCPKFYAYRQYPGENWQEGVWISRLALGGISAVLLVVYLGYAGRAIELIRRERKAERKLSSTKA